MAAVAARSRARRRSAARRRSTSSPKRASAASESARAVDHRSCSSSTPAMNALGLGRPDRRRARRSRCTRPHARDAGPRRDSASEQTAITIALRVPTLANCCGPSAAAHVDGGDQLVVAPGTLRFGPGDELATGTRRVPAVERQLDLGVGGEQRRQRVAGRRGRCRGCRRPCRGCGSAASRPCATRSPAPGRRSPSSAIEPRVGDAGPDAQASCRRPPLRSSGIRVEVEDRSRAACGRS